ncbi:ribosome binding protein [Babesia ovata]|uniref:Ribosome binding protein n=1 Tax=Babesia ovata TaxID=189622 RepID=A0A2H6KAW3_9APIC|nr:ribosome binding protein [Babesia ovata]GBE60130.1 ribosome binding protein [Babesia ovata]
MQSQVAKELNGRIKSFYRNANQIKITSALSRFLGRVSVFYKKLCKSAGGVYQGNTSAKHLTEALLECVPKFLAALYFLLYKVDYRFDAVGGGKWKYNIPGVDGWRWWGLNYGEWGGDKLHGDAIGVVPGGFDATDLKEGWYYYYHGGYYYAENMVEDIKAVVEKKSMHNFFRDIFVTSVIASTGLEHVNTANAIGLVGVFCEIVNAEANKNSSGGQLIQALNDDLKKQREFQGRSIDWDELKKHCFKIKNSLIDNLFARKGFNHTGQSPDINNLNQMEFAKKTAQWFRSNLLKVRQDLRQSQRLNYASSEVPLNFFATTFLFPHGFIFGKGRYGTLGKDRDTLKKEWPSVVKELEQDGRGLKRLVRILKGETSEEQGAGGSPGADEDSEDSDSDDDTAEPSGAPPGPGPEPAPVPPHVPSSSGTSGAGSGIGRGRGRGGRGRGRGGHRGGGRGNRGGRGGGGVTYIVQKRIKTFRKGGGGGKGPDRSSEPQPSPGAVPTQTSASPGESVVNTGQDIAGHEDGDPELDEDLPAHDGSGMENPRNYNQPQDLLDRAKAREKRLQDAKELKEKEEEVERAYEDEMQRLEDERRERQEAIDEYYNQLQHYQDALTALDGNSAIPPDPIDVWLNGNVLQDYSDLLRQQADVEKYHYADQKLHDRYDKMQRNAYLTGNTGPNSKGLLGRMVPQALAYNDPFTGHMVKAPEPVIRYPQAPTMPDFTGQHIPNVNLKYPWPPPPPIQKTTSHPPQPTERFPTYLPKHDHAPQLPDSSISGSKITPDTIPNASIPVDPRVSVAFMPQFTGQAILDLEGTRRFSNVAPTFNNTGKRAPTPNKLPVTVQLEDQSIGESLKFYGSTLTSSSKEEMTLCHVEKIDPPVPAVLFSGSPTPDPNLNSSHNPTAILPPPPGLGGGDIMNSDTVGAQRIVSSTSTPAQDKSVKAPHPPSPGVSVSTGGQFPAESASPSFDHNSKGDEGSQVGNDADSPAVSASQSLGSGGSRGRDGHVPPSAHDLRGPPIILTASDPDISITTSKSTTQDALPNGIGRDGGDGTTEREPGGNSKGRPYTDKEHDMSANILAAKGLTLSPSDPYSIGLSRQPGRPGTTSPGKPGAPPGDAHPQASGVPSAGNGDDLRDPKSQPGKDPAKGDATSPADKPSGTDNAGSDSPTREDQHGRVTPGDTIWQRGQPLTRGKGDEPVWDILDLGQDWDAANGSDEGKDPVSAGGRPPAAATSPTLTQQPDVAANVRNSNSQNVQMQEPVELKSYKGPKGTLSPTHSPSSLRPPGKPNNQDADTHGSSKNALQPGGPRSVARSRSTSVGSRGSRSSGGHPSSDKGVGDHTSSSTAKPNTRVLQYGRSSLPPADLASLSSEEEDDEADGQDDDLSVLSPPRFPSRSPVGPAIPPKPGAEGPGSEGGVNSDPQPVSHSDPTHLPGSNISIPGVSPSSVHNYGGGPGLVGHPVADHMNEKGGKSRILQHEDDELKLWQKVQNNFNTSSTGVSAADARGLPQSTFPPVVAPYGIATGYRIKLQRSSLGPPKFTMKTMSLPQIPDLTGGHITDHNLNSLIPRPPVDIQVRNINPRDNILSPDITQLPPLPEVGNIPALLPDINHSGPPPYPSMGRDGNDDEPSTWGNVKDYGHTIDVNSGMCIDPRYYDDDPDTLSALPSPPNTDHLPPPTTVRGMLYWLLGLAELGYIPRIKEHVQGILKGFSKDVSQPYSALEVTGLHPQLTASLVAVTLSEACLYAASVVYEIKYYHDFEGVTNLMFDSEYGQLYYSLDSACLLCQLLDYVYACHHQLTFLKSQCSRHQSQGGWQECEYGHKVHDSPLQAFLTDRQDCAFETYPFDPYNLCLKSHVKMGFTKEDLPKNRQIGRILYYILSPQCGPEDPLLRLSSYLNCITRRTPRTTGELVSFFHNAGNVLHDAASELSKLGSALSKSYDNCPDWDYLRGADLRAIRDARGSAPPTATANHDKNHPKTLSTLLGCDTDNAKCAQHITPITYRAHSLYSPSIADTYLSWTVYLPDRLWESLLRLHHYLKKHTCSKSKPLHQCDKALPLLYCHGIMPPEGIGHPSLTCTQVMSKLEEVVSGHPIADLMTCMDNFLIGIRGPFLFAITTLWIIATLYIFGVLLYRMDVLRIRSHLLRSKASHLIDVKALLSKGRKLLSLYRDVDYFDDEPMGQLGASQ